MFNQTIATKVLAPYTSLFHEAILARFRDRHKGYAEEISKHTPRTRASLVNDLIVDRALRLLAPLKVRVIYIQNRVIFDIGRALIQFKKLNSGSLASNNYPTEFAQDFNKQVELPGVPAELPRLIVGYVPTRDWTQVLSAYVTMPMGEKVAWAIPLGDESQIQLIKPEEQKDDIQQQKRKRFRRKGGGAIDNPAADTGTDGS